jgi:hypothetical protein
VSADLIKAVSINLPERFWAQIEREALEEDRTLDDQCELMMLTAMLASVCNEEAQAFKQWAEDKPAMLNALQYARDGIVKMADHCDMEAVEGTGLDVQDCRDQVEFAIERAGGEVSDA